MKKPRTYKTLKNLLDRAFSVYIRLRDADSQGRIHCITCGTPHYWKESDCCHYIGRQHMATRWNEQNCAAGCRRCNRFEEGNKINWKMNEHTKNILIFAKNAVKKWVNFELEILIEDFKKRAIEIAKMKGIVL